MKMDESLFRLGLFMKTLDPAFVEVAGLSGFDFVILDYEHGVTEFSQLSNLIRAAKIHNTDALIRVSGINESEIGKALDIGASGIQVPQVKSSADVEKIIEFSKFYPQGKRGVCRFVRAADYSIMPQKEYYNEANKALVVVQLEGLEALENLNSIIQVNGVDVIFIGPYDLSQSLGVPGDVMNPVVVEKMNTIVKECNLRKITVGTFVDSSESLEIWKKAGVSYIAYSVDVGLFADKCREIIQNSK